ncbi:hypothetical protein OSB04_006991 [Centaurea solstitialis]|uniref:Uncharacterized protein n=1 Tax=Centaurea solstitialis TaxID=347529 RepID=A0AA38WT14_9ASTR|nr:hypothetical protein OSB04_006991 [Centaurea solstitialis]
MEPEPEPEPAVLGIKEPEPEPPIPVLHMLEPLPEPPGTGSGGYPAGNGSKKMRTGTGTGLDRFHILGTGTGTTHIGSGSGTGGSEAVPVPKAGTRFRCSPLGISRLGVGIIHVLSLVQSTKLLKTVTPRVSALAGCYTDKDDFKSQSGYVFTLNGGAISWKNSKQDTIADSTTEAEYITASDAAKEVVWLRNFLSDLRVVTSVSRPIDIFCDNSGAVAQAKEPIEHHKSRHVLRKYHLIREIIGRGDVRICKIPTEDNVADPLTKPLARVKHEAPANSIGMQYLDTSS